MCHTTQSSGFRPHSDQIRCCSKNTNSMLFYICNIQQLILERLSSLFTLFETGNAYFTSFKTGMCCFSSLFAELCTFMFYLFPFICPLSSCHSMSTGTLLRLPCGWSWQCFQQTTLGVRGDEMDGAHGQTIAPAPTSRHVQPQQVSPQLWRR